MLWIVDNQLLHQAIDHYCITGLLCLDGLGQLDASLRLHGASAMSTVFLTPAIDACLSTTLIQLLVVVDLGGCLNAEEARCSELLNCWLTLISLHHRDQLGVLRMRRLAEPCL
jgi:hypothetical protein